MTRRCSHCSTNGHNSRTCPNRGVKLFGVRLTDGLIRKSASMGNLTHFSGGVGGGGSTPLNGVVHDLPGDTPDHPAALGGGGGASADGYASEDFVAGSSSNRERKKGVPWTEEEHRMFLLGLQKLGKGDWRGIARNYVISRTPTQVASHAQKYFIRQSNMSRRKRRSSLFDIVADEFTVPSSTRISCFCCSVFPMPYPCWPGYTAEPAKAETHEVLKPTAVHSKSPINVDELVGMSKLSLGESIGDAKPPSLSLKLVEGSSRQSAFHANPSSGSSGMNSSHNPIHAV
ncbi:unnamed protein product [Withania somnifera]